MSISTFLCTGLVLRNPRGVLLSLDSAPGPADREWDPGEVAVTSSVFIGEGRNNAYTVSRRAREIAVQRDGVGYIVLDETNGGLLISATRTLVDEAVGAAEHLVADFSRWLDEETDPREKAQLAAHLEDSRRYLADAAALATTMQAAINEFLRANVAETVFLAYT